MDITLRRSEGVVNPVGRPDCPRPAPPSAR